MNGETWLKSADQALALAASQIKLIRAVTPTNGDAELVELERAFRRGSPRPPRWTYDEATVPVELCVALEKLAHFLDGVSPLGQVYAARARELCLEASIIDSVGTPRIATRAKERFIPKTEEAAADLARADALAASWATDAAIEAPDRFDEKVRTCDTAHPASLISRMSCEAGRAKLPMRIVLQPGLASLAATGDSVIVIATAPHLHELEKRLRGTWIDLDRARWEDRFIPVLAQETLSRFMANGKPDEALFNETAMHLLARARGKGRKVRAFSEMVAILWDEGHKDAAMRLENLWSKLQSIEQFPLFCAYPRAHFKMDAAWSIESVCAAHSRVIPGYV